MISPDAATQNDNTTPSPEIWYQNLPCCFNFRGRAHTVPENFCNNLGIPYINPIILIPEDPNAQEYKPVRAVKLGLKEYVCLICKKVGAANHQSWNNSSAFSHVLKYHPEEYPVNLITKEGTQ